MSAFLDDDDNSAFLDPSNPMALEDIDLPANVLAEGQNDGTITTEWAPRGTIDDARPGGLFNNAGYDIPKTAQEPHGQNPAVTAWAPRGTVDKVPEPFFRKRKADPRLIYADFGTEKDPFVAHGLDTADMIMHTMSTNLDNVQERKTALKAIFDGIDKGMWADVERKANALTKQYGAKRALHKAIATSFANKALAETLKAGQINRPIATGLMGLGGYGNASGAYTRAGMLVNSDLYGPLGMGWWGGDAWRWTKDKVKKAASKVKGAVKTVYSKYTDIYCKLANSGALTIAATAGGAAAGGPGGAQVGAQGAEVVKNLCAGGAPPMEAPVSQQAPSVQMVPIQQSGSNLPIIIGVGAAAVLGIVLLTRRPAQ